MVSDMEGERSLALERVSVTLDSGTRANVMGMEFFIMIPCSKVCMRVSGSVT